jgi:YggT family protein
MNALYYLVDTLLTLYLYVLILRFVMQFTRADFRNQVAHAVLIATNPVVMPLRKIFPPVGKVDSASVLAIILMAAITVGARTFIRAGVVLDPISWLANGLIATPSVASYTLVPRPRTLSLSLNHSPRALIVNMSLIMYEA